MNVKDAQEIASKFCSNCLDITLLEIRGALVTLANFYEDYKHLLTKDDPDHPDYIDPYLRDGENQNHN